MLLNQGASGNISNFQWNYENARKEIVKYIIRRNKPFAMGDDPELEGCLQKDFNPAFKKISRHTI